MKLDEFIVKFAHKGVLIQNKDGSMPAGHNGPYAHKETPVRNTGHWLILFSKSYELTKDNLFYIAAENAASYLISDASRPYNAGFYHRINGGDDCNGLIGPAWTFEALSEATILLHDSKYSRVAEEVYLQHFFNENKCVWNRYTAKSKKGRIDQTFNHQLWFAATSALIDGDSKNTVTSRAEIFLTNINEILLLLDDGLIYHGMSKKLDLRSKGSLLLKSTKNLLKLIIGNYNSNNLEIKRIDNLINKSIGYHSFNMYAFTLLKKALPNHPFWNSKRFKEMLEYVISEKHLIQLESENYYGFPYNVPGFEIPVIAAAFNSFDENRLIDFSERYINLQLRKLFNPDTNLFEKGNQDPATLNARFYEITRLPNEMLKSINIEI